MKTSTANRKIQKLKLIKQRKTCNQFSETIRLFPHIILVFPEKLSISANT